MSFDRGDSTAIAGKTSVLAIEAGGTNASTVAEARTNLGLGTAATTDSTAYAPAAQGVTNGDSHDHSGGDGAQIAYSSLSGTPSLGTISSQNANNVIITGGSVTGITDLTVADGGTGASTAQNARINLLPSYTGNANKILAVNVGETDVSWVSSVAGSGDVVGPASSTDNAIVRFDGTTGKLVQNSSAVIDDSGNVLIGTTTAASTQGATLQVITAEAIRRNIAGTGGGALRFEKSRSATDGGYTIVQDGDTLGDVQFFGADGVDYAQAATIRGSVNGSPASNDMPGALSFLTSASGSQTPTERMRIDSSGNINIATTGARITGDFSNATASNRVMFQSSTTNGNTIVGAIPNGTAVTSALFLHNNSDPANSGYLNLNATSTAVNFNSTIAGTGSYLPVAFYTGGSERMRITSDGEVLVGGTTAIGAAPGNLTLNPTGNIGTLNLFRDDTSVIAGNPFGYINFYGNDTTSNTPTKHAFIQAEASGTHAAGDNPTDLVFGTTPDNSATVTEQMRLTQAGNLQFNSGYGSVATAYGCRAWVNFNGTGTVAIRASGNVTSITDNNVGDYTVNFTASLTDVNYAVTGTATEDATNRAARGISVFTHNTGSCQIKTNPGNNATAVDCQYVEVAILRQEY